MILRYAVWLAVLGATGAAVALALRGRLGETSFRGVLAGEAVAAAGALFGAALLARAFERGPRAVFAAIVAGILGRMVLYGVALVWVALRTPLNATATAISLLLFYGVFQSLEVGLAFRGSGAGPGAGRGPGGGTGA
jgi:hypothetical protein